MGVKNEKELVLLAECLDITHSQPIKPIHITKIIWNINIKIKFKFISLMKSSNKKDAGNKITPDTIN